MAKKRDEETPAAVGEAFELSDEERELAAAEGVDDTADGSGPDEAEGAEGDEPKSPAEPDAKGASPAAEASAEGAAAPAEGADGEGEETLEQLRERLQNTERENEGLKKRLARDRRRQRALLYGAGPPIAPAPPAPPAAPAAPARPSRIPVELDDSGQYSVDPEQLRRALMPPAQPAPPPVSPVAAGVVAYERMRTELLDEVQDPDSVRSAIEDLEGAYAWLDRRLVEHVQQTGVVPRSPDDLFEVFDEEGIREEFERKYPAMDLDSLVEAPTGKRKLERCVSTYLERKGAGSPLAPSKPAAPAAPTASMLRSRPRPMSQRGVPAAGAPSAAQKVAKAKPFELLSMSDDEILEAERELQRA